MIKPVLQKITAIDADRDYTFVFGWNGSPIMGSRITITNVNDATDEIVIESSKNLSSIDYIPSELDIKLKNGHKYTATLQVKYNVNYIDSAENFAWSINSNAIQFLCFETPSLSIEGLNQNTTNIVNIASMNCSLIYDNKGYENNILDTYKVELYQDPELRVLVNTTDVLYTKGVTNNLNAFIGGLIDNTTYYIYAYGATNYGMDVEGHVYPIVVHYSTRLDAAFTALVNDGHVELNIHEHTITGCWGNDESEVYNDTRTKAIVDKGGITFSKGFLVDNNFKGIIKCGNIKIDNSKPIVVLSEIDSNKNKYSNYIELIPVTDIKYSLIADSESDFVNLTGTRDVRILCLSFDENGIASMNYSNYLQVNIISNDNTNFYIETPENQDFIIELSGKNGYFDINFRREESVND